MASNHATDRSAPAAPIGTPLDGGFVAEPKYRTDTFDISHLNGVPWFEAPVPRRFHRCWVQTRAWIGLDLVQRCACGSIRNPLFGERSWMERNSRKAKNEPPPDVPYMERKRAEVEVLNRIADGAALLSDEADRG